MKGLTMNEKSLTEIADYLGLFEVKKPKGSTGEAFESQSKKFSHSEIITDEDMDFGSFHIAKGQELHYILGVVLEPEVLDATRTEKSVGDIYNVDEVRKAAHRFMLEYRGQGNDFMHNGKDNPEAYQIVESYLAPADMVLGNEEIKKGTWLMGSIVFDEQIWKDVKGGRITGYSIGGYSNARFESAT